jgi:hypothetical protein
MAIGQTNRPTAGRMKPTANRRRRTLTDFVRFNLFQFAWTIGKNHKTRRVIGFNDEPAKSFAFDDFLNFAANVQNRTERKRQNRPRRLDSDRADLVSDCRN